MNTCVALLRGINLGNRNKVGMAELAGLFVALGHSAVRTHLRSGNVVFATASTDQARLAGDIEAALADELGLAVRVLLRDAAELRALVAANPFVARGADPAALHVTFLAEPPDPARWSERPVPDTRPDEFAVRGRDVYLCCPAGYGRTTLNNAFWERRSGVPATTRNWRTVTALLAMAGD
ncbi:DUF1697 domain-containing protein [Goodfellowiella coeruleoviolacea]|uniref:Uncharacterized conserved protein, DUF1697 family n=1 Tax=Goodfellowiella coeruleoviolacea TaxID=334858 RepID=A0AAE3GH29_9PSEU|nr:DUF1697 domain-containing protein [Goodfellowiella coeruleoviolacea]MCP2167220.1 Uncharacterized conserved protein, DUF1697 family [Goodfellowiella coeruleoviolacea]